MNDIGNSPSARDIESIIHPYTNLDVHRTKGPMIIEKGKGVMVWDDEGREYIEGMAGLWCASFGFGEEELIDAAVEQMRKLPFYHQFGHKSSMPSIELAEKLLEIAPKGMSKVFFANSGSEANDSQVKLQWYVNNALGRPEKKKILSRIKGYHGVTVASASLTGLPANHAEFDLPIHNIGHVDMAYPYRGMEPGETEEDYSTRLAEALEKRILEEGPDTVAAFIAEPVCGAGGVLVPPAGYFPKIQAVLKKYDIMMIADEVICGFGRTGNVWGCLASFMPFAFNMRLAKEQIWWSQKWQHFTFSGLDKRIYSFNKNMLQNHYGQPWYCGWFQKKSWLEPIDAEDVRSLRQQFAGKVILGSLCRTEKMHDAAFLNTVSQLLLDNDNVIYLWAGREQDPAIQQHFTDAGVSQKTRYIGWVNTSLFASVFDIFLDSFPAGSGITAIQAMQAGKPVVTHRCTDNVKSLDNLFTSFFGNQQNTEFLGRDAMHKNDVSCNDQASPFTFAEDQNEYRMIVQNLINDCELREKVGNNYKNFVTENFCSPEMAERRFTDCLLIEV